MTVLSPLPEGGLIVRPRLHAIGDCFAHLAVQARFGTAVKHGCLIQVMAFQLGRLEVVQHHTITDQVAVVRHQHPVVQ